MFEEPQKVQQIIRAVAAGSQIVAGATSAFIIYAVIGNQLPDHWNTQLVIGITVVAVVFILSIIELFPKSMMPSALDMLFGPKTSTQTAFVVFTLALCFALQGVSILTSYHSKNLIAQSVVEEPDLVRESSYILRKDSLIEAARKRYDQQIDELRTNEQDRIGKAEENKKGLLATAISSKGTQMKKLFNDGNGWAKKQLQKATTAAEDNGNAQIDYERNRIDLLSKERDSVIKSMEFVTERRHSMISAENTRLSNSYSSEIEHYDAFACWFGIGGTIIFILMQFLASIHRRATGLQLVYTKGAPPLMYAIFNVFTRLVNSLSRGVYKISEGEEMMPLDQNHSHKQIKKKKKAKAPEHDTNRIYGNRKDGYEITCLHCDQPAVKKSPKAKFCSSECRIAYNEEKNGYKVSQIIKHRKRTGTVSA